MIRKKTSLSFNIRKKATFDQNSNVREDYVTHHCSSRLGSGWINANQPKEYDLQTPAGRRYELALKSLI